MGFFKRKQKKSSDVVPELYTEQEVNEIEDYIINNFGQFDNVFHEIVSPDIHVDIAIIEPNEKDNYYKLITMGMGAHHMSIPPELEGNHIAYAELMICLPPNWNLKSDEENDYWPFRWLKILARLPIDSATWLGYGHTIAAGEQHETLSDNNLFEGIGLVNATTKSDEEAVLRMSNDKVVNFYQLIPLYGSEMNLKLETEEIGSILDLFDEEDKTYVINIHRKNYVDNK